MQKGAIGILLIQVPGKHKAELTAGIKLILPNKH